MTPNTKSRPFQSHTADQAWLAEARVDRDGKGQVLRCAVLAPTAGIAETRLNNALSARGMVSISEIRHSDSSTLDEEAGMIARLAKDSRIATSQPCWARVSDSPVTGPFRRYGAEADSEGELPLPSALLRPWATASEVRQRLYAVLDAASIFGLRERLSNSGLPYACLFKGHAESEYANVAPYLLELRPESRFVRRLLTPGPPDGSPAGMDGTRCGVFLRSGVSLTGLVRHFRYFTMLPDGETGKRSFFRFYDPRVFRTLVMHMEPDDLALFGRGIDVMGAIDRRGKFLLLDRRPVTMRPAGQA